MNNISLGSEYVMSIFGFPITNTFLTSVLVMLFLSVMVLFFRLFRKNQKNTFVAVVKVFIFELLKLTDMVTQDRKLSKKILPLIATFFLFIFTANLLAIAPGFLGSFFIDSPTGKISFLRSPNSDLTTTGALAIFSVFSIQFFSLRALGLKGYLGRFFKLSNPLEFITGFFEMLSEIVKVFSFSFRLFGNIFAGEVLLLVIAFLVPYIVPLPFMIMEVFVGIIQAFVFMILTLTFAKTGTISISK